MGCRSSAKYLACKGPMLTGHNVWGILNAPATGDALAELIVDGTSRTTDLTPFDPARLTPLERSLLRSS
jgi:glycine/D-amino acid oxidase-like deaminating enzyme